MPDAAENPSASIAGSPCDDAVHELYAYLDGEIDAGTRERIEAHITDCYPCLEAFDFERELRHVVATKAKEPCPAALKAKILEILERAAAEVGSADGPTSPGDAPDSASA